MRYVLVLPDFRYTHEVYVNGPDGESIKVADPLERHSEQALAGMSLSDPAVFNTLDRRHRRRIYAYHLADVGRPEEADDLSQDMLVRAFDHLPTYRQTTAPFGAWLTHIARNAVVDSARRSRRYVPWGYIRSREPTSEEARPEEPRELVDDLRRVRTSIAVLPENLQKLLALVVWADLISTGIDLRVPADDVLSSRFNDTCEDNVQ